MTTKSIRFFYNGIRVNGDKTMIKCYYSLDNHVDYEKCVHISVRSYGDDLPGDVFPVVNNSDTYTDYFEKDHAVLVPGHPLYKFARCAAAKAAIREVKYYIKHYQSELEVPERWPGRHKYVAGELARQEARLAELQMVEDPGQPTEADLAAVETMRMAEENARREAEERARQEAREKVIRQSDSGRDYIRSVAKRFPVVDGEPVVIVCWSEHPAFYSWEDDELKLSVAAAEIVLRHYDAEASADAEASYFKTKFRIEWTEPGEVELSVYDGRYDLGDNEGGMISHIRNIGTWELNHDLYGHEKEKPDATNAKLKFADMLEQYTASAKFDMLLARSNEPSNGIKIGA